MRHQDRAKQQHAARLQLASTVACKKNREEMKQLKKRVIEKSERLFKVRDHI